MFRVGARLAFERNRLAAERVGPLPEQRTQKGKAFQRIVGAVRDAVAVAPLVVAGNEDERRPAGIEQLLAIGENLVVATGLPVLDVADMGDERDVAVGDGVQHERQFAPFAGRVGDIADQCELPRFAPGQRGDAKAGAEQPALHPASFFSA